MIWVLRRRLRTRLTIWYVYVLAAILVLSWAATCGLLFWTLRAQLTHFSIEEIENVEGLLYFTREGQLRLREDYHNHPESRNVIERFVEVLSTDGTVLFRNDRLGGHAFVGTPSRGEGVGGYSERSERLSDGTRIRAVSRVHVLDGRQLLMRLAYSEEPLYTQLKNLFLSYLAISPIVLLAAWFAGHELARRALAPIEEMARRAKDITPEKLHARLPVEDMDEELGDLARVFNATLERVERAFEQLRAFTADVSHELRTPLAMMRTVGEVGLGQKGNRSTYRDIIGSMLEEVNRLTSLVENLLTISRADSGEIELHRSAIPCAHLAREAAALLEILMEEKSLRCNIAGDDELQVQGDNMFLRQALVNVIHNAIKYSPEGGLVSINVFHDSKPNVIFEIQDNGPGILIEDQRKVFDRFYRVSKDRGRESGGAGLGLSIAKWAVEAHGGTIALKNGPQTGCICTIAIPGGTQVSPTPLPSRKQTSVPSR